MICRKSDPGSQVFCARLLCAGEILILPTDTVYGFSGIVGTAGEKIRAVKGRAEEKPFIQLIASPSDIASLTDDVVPQRLLALWPGALTVIVNDKKERDKTVAVRCPGDAWLRGVIGRCGLPIYSTSVNRSGMPPLSSVSEIRAEFEHDVALIVDDGDKDAVPSTIVRLECGGFFVVRQGSVTV